MAEQPLVLATIDYYLPGYKGGGPMRTLVNVVDQLGDEFRFKIVTQDRDLGDFKPYPGVVADSWRPFGKAKVFYLSRQNRSWRTLRNLFRAPEPDVLYLNSFFSPTFTIKPLLLRWLGLVPRVPLVLAPRGEFSPSALALKGLKKRAFLVLARTLGLYVGAVWQASSEHEEKDIREWFGDHATVLVVPDLPTIAYKAEKHPRQRKKVAGRLKIVFLSRISPMKNLAGALTMLKDLQGEVQFDIYGPLEDKSYWKKCQKIINLLPQNVQVRYRGAVAPDQVPSVMGDHDLFLFPTLGENFGHVVLEALTAACPVLVSDRTPWRDLRNRGAGWDLPLDQPERFRAALQECVDMDTQEHQTLSQRARTFGLERVGDQTVLDRYRELLNCALRRT